MTARPTAQHLPLLLFLVGAAATIALLLLYAYAPDLRDDSSSASDAVSRSAVGYAGLNRLLTLSGIPTEIDRGVIGGTRPSLTILTPPITTSTPDWRAYQEQSGVLIILPKWLTAPMPLHPGWVTKTGVYFPAALAHLIAPIANFLGVQQRPGDWQTLSLTGDSSLKGLPPNLSERIQQLQTLSLPLLPANSSVTALLSVAGSSGNQSVAAKAGIVLVRLHGGDKPIYILSEPDLMNNQGLADKSTAQAALAIIQSLRQGGGPVRLDVTMDGLGRDPSLLKVLFETPFRGATICALLTAVLMALHALARFGAPARSGRIFARGKKALAGNTAELVRMMGREGAMAQRYVQSARDLVLAQVGGRRHSAAEQERLLAAMEASAHSDIHYGELAAEAAEAKNGGDLMRIATRTYAWRGRITGEH